MKKSININSSEWCDIIFEGKNKSYGAFELRQSSTKRHILAFGIILLFTIVVAFLPGIISSIKASSNSYEEKRDEKYTILTVENKVEEPEILQPEIPAPPKQEYVKMTKFVPPTIVENSEVTDEDEMTNMSDLTKGTEAIGGFTVEKGSDNADAVRKEFEQQATAGLGDGKPQARKIFEVVEIMPQFPGGDAELYKYISNNLKYPVVDQEMGIEGRVIVRFVVSKTGEITNIELIKGISQSSDKEAMRVVKSMPRWIPGKQQGVPVPVYFTLPVVFRLKK